MFKKLLDNTDPGSLANKFRRKRFSIFKDLIRDLPRPVKILDAGGTVNYWEQMGLTGNIEFEITIVNPEIQENPAYGNIKQIKGDARNLSFFKNKSFDAVFSNSVIEHIPSAEGRKQFAAEIQRLGRSYFVQTPNYWFPFEPHFLFPFFQFFPVRIKIFFLVNFSMGWFKKCANKNEAMEVLKNNQLLEVKEFKSYFPDSKIQFEKIFLFKKSIILKKDLN